MAHASAYLNHVPSPAGIAKQPTHLTFMANDHYIPQFYLRNFAIPAKSGWVYSYKRNFKPIGRAIKSLASEEGYYTIKRDGLSPDFVDELYKIVETKSAPLINRLVNDHTFSLSRDEKGTLSWFLALLAFRTPWAKKLAMDLNVELSKRDIKRLAADRAKFGEFARSIDPDVDADTLEERRQILLNFDENLAMSHVDGDENQFHYAGFGIMIARDLAPMLYKKEWHIIESGSSEVFVTSDNPVILLPPPDYRSGTRVGFDNAPVYVALSPKRALMLDNSRSSSSRKVGRKMVKKFNWHIINQAYRYVFASSELQEVQSIFDGTKEGEHLEIRVD